MDTNEDKEKIDRDEVESDNIEAADFSYDSIDEDGEENLKEKLATLRKKLKDCEKEKSQYLEGWQRSKADFVNLKKEEERSRVEFLKFAEERLMLRLMPSLESFSVAVNGAKENENLPKDWRVGMEYINQQLLQSLKESGLEEINPKVGENFDPRFHSVATTEETEREDEDQKIVKVLQSGFSLSEKVLKPASVVVKNFIKK